MKKPLFAPSAHSLVIRAMRNIRKEYKTAHRFQQLSLQSQMRSYTSKIRKLQAGELIY